LERSENPDLSGNHEGLGLFKNYLSVTYIVSSRQQAFFMKVEVKLFAPLQAGRFEKARVNLDKDSSIADLLEKLDILPSDVGILAVNEQDATFDQALHEGDAVTIIPAIGGG